MKLESKLFDKVRIQPRHRQAAPVVDDVPVCAWEGCEEKGHFKAPKGRRSEGQYHHFCLEHVRHYNTAFNFFEGMQPDEMEAELVRERATDGRPAWGLGARPAGPGAAGPGNPPGGDPYARTGVRQNGRRYSDPFNIFARYRRTKAQEPQKERVRPLHEQDRRAFETLGFEGFAKPAEVKAAYKSLVKLHHPDANGGSRSSEDRLRTIIAAYAHLKQKGFVNG